ncbi:MAG: hypothetical protein JWO33_2720 [Caulobacteraceae bacterium]|nr:hypothetical protein [Caulobacteraceae bacterium]
MRRVAIAAALVLAGCAGAGESAKTAGERVEAKAPGALAQPLHDINVLRTKIPPVLLEAMDRPYVPPQPLTCREVINQIRPLDEALGPDLDAPPSLDNPSAMERNGVMAGDAITSAVRGAATDIIPLRSWVRMLTGAERYDNLVKASITAGAVRRAYLKGIGVQLDCLPPAAPQPIALKGEQTVRPVEKPKGPQFPIR